MVEKYFNADKLIKDNTEVTVIVGKRRTPMPNKELNKLFAHKSIHTVYLMMGQYGYKKLFTDVCGIYYPDRDFEDYGHYYITWLTEYDKGILYAGCVQEKFSK